ncbi:hypothetical protein V4R08_13640 [Nitrobacter sp. NHB1]
MTPGPRRSCLSELPRVIVDTTMQIKNVTFPTDAKLLNRARENWGG